MSSRVRFNLSTSFHDASGYSSEDSDEVVDIKEDLDFTSPLFTMACTRHGFKPEDLMKKTLEEIKEIHKKEKYSEEAYRLLTEHYEQRRHVKIRIILKERNRLLEDKIAELHPPLHYQGKSIVYALGASVNRYKDSKAKIELKQLIHQQDAELIELLLQEKELGRDNYGRIKALERQRLRKGHFGLTLYPRPPREIEYIEADEIRRLRARKKLTKHERQNAKEVFEREHGIPYETSAKPRREKPKPKGHRNYIVQVPGSLLETKLVFKQKSFTPASTAVSFATRFMRSTPAVTQTADDQKYRPQSTTGSHRPVIMDRKKDKKIMFQKGRALGPEIDTELEITVKSKRSKASESTYMTPKKTTPKVMKVTKRNTTGSKAQKILLDNIQQSQNELLAGKSTPYNNESSDDEWERDLASTYKSPQRWLDNWKTHDPKDFTKTPESKPQSKMSLSSSKGFYQSEKVKAKANRSGSSVPPKEKMEHRSVGPVTERAKPRLDSRILGDDQGEVSQFEEDILRQTGFRSTGFTGFTGCSDDGKSRCLGMVSPQSFMRTPVDQKFYGSFNADKTISGFSSTKMYDGASNDRSDGFKSTFLNF